ncbi:MAG: (d)CMP kinase [Paracoccaceae bacterium]|jgi:cytidylate kinase|tara:strand:+ start:113 stop:736 length:624 start_codon:yes stop_codon:yes gene_type:complete
MIFTVAVDGPAASGKGTISRQISKYFGFSYLDTGLIYRYIGSKVLGGISPFQALSDMDYDSMNSKLLRVEAVSIAASKIAADPKVREALVCYQKSFAKKMGGAVLDGRDIGTVISPDADIKFFVTASEKVRAERRFKELSLVDKELTFEDLLRKIKKRDRADKERSISPLVRAEDAVLLDTTELSIDTSVDIAINAVSKVLKSKTEK